MKKIFFLLCFAFSVSAYATIRQCVYVPTKAPSSESDFEGGVEWNMTTNGVQISGVAACAQMGGTVGATRDVISRSATISSNIYCWCKSYSPAVSKWVFVGSEAAADCRYYCANICSNLDFYGAWDALRNAMFN